MKIGPREQALRDLRAQQSTAAPKPRKQQMAVPAPPRPKLKKAKRSTGLRPTGAKS